jgi:hypothetical protein
LIATKSSLRGSSYPRLCRLGFFVLPTLLVILFACRSEVASGQSYRSPLILSSYSVSFGDMQAGKVTPQQTVTVFNTGASPVHITSISVDGDFAQTNNCPSPPDSLAPNDVCDVQIVFKPSATRTFAGTLTIAHDAAGSPLTVRLSGTGRLGGPEIAMSPSTLSFAEQKLGIASAPQEITVSNMGTRTVVLTNIGIKGDFTIMPNSTCETMNEGLPVNASCKIVVTFSPLQLGKSEGQVSITNNEDDKPETVQLSGTGSQ